MLPPQPIRNDPDAFQNHFDDVYSNYRQKADQGVLTNDEVIGHIQEMADLQRRHDTGADSEGEYGLSDVRRHEAMMAGLDLETYE